MTRFTRYLLCFPAVLGMVLCTTACSEQGITGIQDALAAAPKDAIARVGDQTITFGEINTMINSSAIVGLSVPTLGTPERDTVRLTLLDRMISANLLYLDAREKGIDKDPGYRREVENFSDAILASLYQGKTLVGELSVSEQEIRDFHAQSIAPGTALTDEVRTAIEATLRKRKFKQRIAGMRGQLREGSRVQIIEGSLSPDQDESRAESEVVARLDGQPIHWREVGALLSTPVNAGSPVARSEALNRAIDKKIMARKARAAGLERDPVYLARVGEFRKTRLINIHRGRLVESMQPSDAQIERYFEENRDGIIVREVRKVQMVVLKSEPEAERIKQKIASGEMTLYKAAAEYSTDPKARKTLGEIGWVTQGSGFPDLDRVTFSLQPDEIGGPVQSPAGWHLVRILDQRDPVYTDIGDEATRHRVRRRMIDEQLAQYVVGLRKNQYPVAVFEDLLVKLAQQEVDWYRQKSESEQVSAERVMERIETLRK